MGVERPCLICGAESAEAGWVKSADAYGPDDPVFWICQRCGGIDDYRIDWSGPVPVARQRYPERKLAAYVD